MRVRRAVLLVVAASALFAVLAGVARLGLAVPVVASRTADHGPLLVLGVFTTVIALERAAALDTRWRYLAPLAGAFGAAAQIAGLRAVGAWAACAAAAALVAVNAAVVRRQAQDFTWLMLLASVALVPGAGALALGRPVFEVVPLWMAFFVATIVAERLELSRLAPTPRWAKRALAVVLVALALSALAALASPGAVRAFGVTLALAALWQLRFDLARRTVKRPGLPRYAALGVLLGAGWLGLSGAALAAHGLPAAGPTYDALLHGVFVGYVLSMVFAHAPIVLPAVARIEVPFHAGLPAALGLLHASLAARIAGDFAGHAGLRTAGGVGNALALAVLVGSVIGGRMRRR